MSTEHSGEARESITRFGKLLAELARNGVDFAVVGGLAVIFNGYDRLTLDADILVSLKSENIEKLLGSLGRWGEGFARELRPDEFIPQEGSIRVIEEFELDIFTQMQGKTLEDFRPRLRQLGIENTAILYLSPEDLIDLKKGSWRDKDKLDVAAMTEIIRRERIEQQEPEN